jgi:hypothetical protein
MADKRLPVLKMRIDENREKIIILKRAAKGAGIGPAGQCDKKDAGDERSTRETIHAMVILQRAVMV